MCDSPELFEEVDVSAVADKFEEILVGVCINVCFFMLLAMLQQSQKHLVNVVRIA